MVDFNECSGLPYVDSVELSPSTVNPITTETPASSPSPSMDKTSPPSQLATDSSSTSSPTMKPTNPSPTTDLASTGSPTSSPVTPPSPDNSRGGPSEGSDASMSRCASLSLAALGVLVVALL